MHFYATIVDEWAVRWCGGALWSRGRGRIKDLNRILRNAVRRTNYAKCQNRNNQLAMFRSLLAALSRFFFPKN